MTSTAIDPVEVRRIQAELAKLLYEELSQELDDARALDLFRRAITKSSMQEGAVYAQASDGDKSPANYLELMQSWAEDGTLEILPISVESDKVHFHVTRCKYAEMYQAANMVDLGGILSCGRDGAVCIGYNPHFKLERPQTIMEGAEYCDFRIRCTTIDRP